MMKKEEAEEIFEVVCKDSKTWLAQAEQLIMSANAIKVGLQDVMARIRFENGLDEPFLAFLKSFMLLSGIAVENLIKGILVGRDPSYVSRDFINNRLLPKGGHGIAEGAKRVINVSNAEYDLLIRLEVYLVWAGKYPMPLNSEAFLNSENLRSISWADFDLIEKLFDRLSKTLTDEWNVRERSKSCCGKINEVS